MNLANCPGVLRNVGPDITAASCQWRSAARTETSATSYLLRLPIYGGPDVPSCRRWCIAASAAQESRWSSPSQNMNEYSQERRNRSHWPKAERERKSDHTENNADDKRAGAHPVNDSRRRKVRWCNADHSVAHRFTPSLRLCCRRAGAEVSGMVFHLLLVYSICRDLPGLRLFGGVLA